MSTTLLQNAFLPTQVSGCQLWLDAADTSTITGTSPVTAWRDKSGTGRTVSFTGTNTYTSSPASVNTNIAGSYFSANTDIRKTTVPNVSIFLVYKWNSSASSGSNQFLWGGDVGGGWNRIQILTFPAATSIQYGLAYTSLAPNVLQVSGINNGNLLMYNANYSYGVVNGTYVNVNGSLSTSLATEAAASTQTSYSGIIFGNGNDDAAFSSSASFSEMIIYNTTLTTSQRQQVEGYLAAKWGLQSSLPSNHPYKYGFVTSLPSVSTIISMNGINRFNNASFNPTSIPGCQLWFDANDSASIFSDTAATTPITPGGSVARCNDKSGNNNYLQQATAGSRPVYQKTPGGYNGIYFVNTPIQMTTVNNSPVIGNASRTIFLIQQAGSVTRVGTGPHATTSPPNTFGIDNNGSQLFCPYVYAAADNIIAVNLTSLAEIWAYYDASVSQIGGNYNFSTAQTKSTTLNTSATPWYFGLRPDTAASINSYICEFIMYDTFLTTAQRQQIEGYLAWKWGLVANLPSTHPYKAAPFTPFSAVASVASLLNTNQLNSKFITTYFNPKNISGMQLWLDGADRSSITFASANTISAWNDKSGNGYNLSQGTSSYQPTYYSNYVNLGTASNYYLNMPQGAVNNASSWSLFFVFNPSSSSNWLMAKQFDGVNSLNILSMTYNGFRSSGTTNVLYFKAQNGATLFSGPAALTTSAVQLISMIYDGTNMYYYLNGSLGSTTSGSFGILNVGSATTCTLGAWIVGGSFENSGTTNFNLGEFQFFNTALTNSQRQQVEGYLAWKWGLQANLPSTQPYKSFPPPP